MQFHGGVQAGPVFVALNEVVLDQRRDHHDQVAFLLFDHGPEVLRSVVERALSGDIPIHDAGSFDLHLRKEETLAIVARPVNRIVQGALLHLHGLR